MDIEDTSDLYVICKINDEAQSTDIHFRSTTGKGEFNYRLVYKNVMFPLKNTKAVFQVWDKDLLSSDEMASSCDLDFTKIADLAF